MSENKEWANTTDTEGAFDISMGSYDGAGICDFIWLFLLDTLGKVFPRAYFTINRDDALDFAKNTNGQDRLKKNII